MKIEYFYQKVNGLSAIINDRYQVYFSDWVVYHLKGNTDYIAQYVWKVVEKLKKLDNIDLIIKK